MLRTISFLLLVALLVQCAPEKQSRATTTFVSFPDFFNFDVPYPWPQWDGAVDHFLTEVRSESPDFVLVAGDLVNGHWWDGPKCVEQMGALYYSDWIARLQKHGLKYYTAIGDHELGDDPWPPEKIALVPEFERVYASILAMPQNGPENKKGLAYYVRQKDLLLITVETFEVEADTMNPDVVGEQLAWLKQVLEANSDAKFKVVQGHVPIWGENRSRSSSRIMLSSRKDGEFYKTLIHHDVDLYLCGEFHDVTVMESEGLWQVVHGSSWGREIVNTQDYLVCRISGDEMSVALKRIYMDAAGDYMYNLNKDRGPQEIVTINEQTLRDGPETTGTLTIRKEADGKKYLDRTGYFGE